ncbi:MAG: Ribosomal-protein-alanine N-acetyltransferase [uncultured Aureispira sp.]|uniref:Ribosomal-protein-alanine N-acetyltransferase n=1 Tax=uncultured Aureispira sp. TaxID=1331704 RepID=A0A6S6TK34_9BACT|nr:MAG: Ribosomal-protein-alanine N-acetyltransferase [uncultured Aureispira sp.]
MKNPKIYETERLFLSPTTVDDAAFVLELLNSPKWIQNIGDRKVRSLEEAEAYISTKMLPQLEALGFSNYTLIRKTDGAKIGSSGLYSREGIEGVDIGFALLPGFERQGYSFEAANKLMELAKGPFQLSKVSGITLQTNKASQGLLEKLGLKFSKLIRLPDDPEELMLYECFL